MLTATQCVIYSTTNWNAHPELRGIVSLIVQSRDHFAMVDTVNGLQVLDGRVLSQPLGMRADFLSPLALGYASDAVALIDPADAKSVRLFDPITAKQTSTITRTIEVEAVALANEGLRRLALIDKNRDLYLAHRGRLELYKLHVMVDTIRWNDDNGSLYAVADSHLVVWHYPEVVYMDRELLPATTSKQDASAVGKTATVRPEDARDGAPLGRRGGDVRHLAVPGDARGVLPKGEWGPRCASAAT